MRTLIKSDLQSRAANNGINTVLEESALNGHFACTHITLLVWLP